MRKRKKIDRAWERVEQAQQRMVQVEQECREWDQRVAELETEYREQNWPERTYGRLAQARRNKNVFQMHHLKVRSAAGLEIQEVFAVFAANFVRWAAVWLHQTNPTAIAHAHNIFLQLHWIWESCGWWRIWRF